VGGRRSSGRLGGMDAREPLRLALLRMTVGEQPPEGLPWLAADALSRGLDSPALRELAGAPAVDHQQNRDLFIEAMRELGAEAPSTQDASRALVRHWAEEILSGTLAPHEGARRIWWKGWEALARPDDLAVFVVLASEWEDDLDHRDDCEQDIIAAARALLAT
jgi:hypothetical protein